MAQPVIALPDLRQAFVDAGVSVSEWADHHGFRRESVYAVLSGRSKGRRGEAHRIAVALGLKSLPSAARLANLQRVPSNRLQEDEPGLGPEGTPMS